MNDAIERAAREIVPVPDVDTTAADGFVRQMAIQEIAKANDRRSEVAAILRKHLPASQGAEQCDWHYYGYGHIPPTQEPST